MIRPDQHCLDSGSLNEQTEIIILTMSFLSNHRPHSTNPNKSNGVTVESHVVTVGSHTKRQQLPRDPGNEHGMLRLPRHPKSTLPREPGRSAAGGKCQRLLLLPVSYYYSFLIFRFNFYRFGIDNRARNPHFVLIYQGA